MSTNHAAMDAFGIAPERALHDVGLGRRPLFAVVAVGLSIALALGMDQFEPLLQGGHDMDEHFRIGAARAQPAGADGPARRLEQ